MLTWTGPIPGSNAPFFHSACSGSGMASALRCNAACRDHEEEAVFFCRAVVDFSRWCEEVTAGIDDGIVARISVGVAALPDAQAAVDHVGLLASGLVVQRGMRSPGHAHEEGQARFAVLAQDPERHAR